jgi:hypothetical protein
MYSRLQTLHLSCIVDYRRCYMHWPTHNPALHRPRLTAPQTTQSRARRRSADTTPHHTTPLALTPHLAHVVRAGMYTLVHARAHTCAGCDKCLLLRGHHTLTQARAHTRKRAHTHIYNTMQRNTAKHSRRPSHNRSDTSSAHVRICNTGQAHHAQRPPAYALSATKLCLSARPPLQAPFPLFLSDTAPSPTLSATDPVPRGLLTLAACLARHDGTLPRVSETRGHHPRHLVIRQQESAS